MNKAEWTRVGEGEYRAHVPSGAARLVQNPSGNWRISINGCIVGIRDTLERAEQFAEKRRDDE